MPQGTQVAVIWIGINDARRGVELPQIRSNVIAIVGRLRARGVATYVIQPPVYNVKDHSNPAITIPDRHFNAAGYRIMVGRTIGPVQTLVKAAAKKKAA